MCIDEVSHGILEFDDNIVAEVSASIREDIINDAVIIGNKGKIELD